MLQVSTLDALMNLPPMQEMSLKACCESVKNVIAFVVTRELIAKTLYKRHYALEDFPKCSNNLNHSRRALSQELWPYRTAAGFHQANFSGSIY